jgi:hypothetical protein
MTDRVGKALERVAREMTEQIRINGTVFIQGGLENWNPPAPGKVAELSAALLEERLGPLLRAGQAMRDCGLFHRSKKDWDKALEALAALESEHEA